jgi:hypothetical protein
MMLLQQTVEAAERRQHDVRELALDMFRVETDAGR